MSLGVVFGLFLMLVISFTVLGRSQYNDTVSHYPDTFLGVSPYEGSGIGGGGEMPSTMSREQADIGFIQQERGQENRSLIKTASISIAVDDIDQTVREVNILQNTYNATTMNLGDYGRGLNRRLSMTIRVEQTMFDALYRSLRKIEGESESASISVSDVTETVLDLETRLNNYRKVEAQYLDILEKAETVEDTLAVYRELNGIRLEIERVEAQLKNLETQTEYSYIYLNIFQSSAGAEITEEKWRPEGIFMDALRSLLNFAQSIGSIIIWLVVFSPVMALIILPILHLRKKAKK